VPGDDECGATGTSTGPVVGSASSKHHDGGAARVNFFTGNGGLYTEHKLEIILVMSAIKVKTAGHRRFLRIFSIYLSSEHADVLQRKIQYNSGETRIYGT